MSTAALERLSQVARWSEAEARDIVVRQGDVGEAFYVIHEGRMAVPVGGSYESTARTSSPPSPAARTVT
jgi:CRP-like cAMP-binding protein